MAEMFLDRCRGNVDVLLSVLGRVVGFAATGVGGVLKDMERGVVEE